MALSVANLTSGGTATANTVFTTASITPTAGRLWLAWIFNTKNTGGTGAYPTISGAGLTWVPVMTEENGVSTDARVTLFVGFGTPSAGTVAITYGSSQNSCQWKFHEWAGTGVPVIVQSKGVSALTTPAAGIVTLDFTPGTGTGYAVVAGFSKDTQNAYTVGSGFTSDFDAGFGLPQSRALVEYDIDVTDGIADCTWAAATDYAAIAIEITDTPPPIVRNAMALSTAVPVIHATDNTVSVINTSGALVLLALCVGDTGGAPAVPTSITGLGLTWVLVNSATVGNVLQAVYRAMGAASSGVITITWAAGTDSAIYQLDEFVGIDQSGTNGSGGIVQSATSAANTTTPTVTLSTPLATSAVYAATNHNDTALIASPGSGFSLLGAGMQTQGTPSQHQGVEWDPTAPGTSVAFSWSGAGNSPMVALEMKLSIFKAAPGPVGGYRSTLPARVRAGVI